MAVDHGTRTVKTAAAKVLEIDGAFHGLDVHKMDGQKVYITQSCGQIRAAISEWYQEVKPYLAYHLNDMHAGTERQEAELARHTWDGTGGDHYKWACRVLQDAGLLDDTEHMVRVAYKRPNSEFKRYKMVPYRYGSQWLKRELPAEVVKWFKELPADKTREVR